MITPPAIQFCDHPLWPYRWEILGKLNQEKGQTMMSDDDDDVCECNQTEPMWIPMTERKPSNGDYVYLANEKNRSYAAARWIGGQCEEWATHWYPAGQPPKELPKKADPFEEWWGGLRIPFSSCPDIRTLSFGSHVCREQAECIFNQAHARGFLAGYEKARVKK